MNTFNSRSNQSGYAKPKPVMIFDLSKIKFAESIEQLTDDNLFSNHANLLAEEIAEKSNTNNRTQIRKFYDELVMWDEKINSSDDTAEVNYKANKVLLKMMKAKVAYAKGRKHIDFKFEDFFNHCIDQVNGPQKLRQFKLFFEPFMGYYRIHKSN